MRDVLTDLLASWRAGADVGVATVVKTWRSAPRPAGASMFVREDGSVVGSVSGGCVEGAVYELAQSVVASGVPVLQRYGVSDDDAFAVGLTCGGILDVFVEHVSPETFPELADVAADIAAGTPVAVATLIEHVVPEYVGKRLVVRHGADGEVTVSGGLGDEHLSHVVARDTEGLLASGRTETRTYGPSGDLLGEGARVFIASHAPAPRLIVFGAVDFSAALARQGSFLGYHVTVCDARPVFATKARMPGADEVVVDWPHRYLAREAAEGRVDARTVIVVLTHDPKFDVPVLEVALRLEEVGYVGAMGSRRTHDDRVARLREVGLTEDELGRLSSPVGLDLGARTPEETAVSIAAEIIALGRGGSGGRLGVVTGPIHGA